jgi:diaminohydroxyphosphoribosylaminopyrimidine deaminase/5-amino-6-(5-phosphoribosylamino)uracil reductase
MSLTPLEIHFSQHALALARRGLYTTTPNPRVGAVIFQGEKIAGEGWHEKAGANHAEINALQKAQTIGVAVKGATMVVTLEPCAHHGKTPPCVEALIHSGIRRLIVLSGDPNPLVAGQGLSACASAGIEVVSPDEIKTHHPALVQGALQLNRGFFSRFLRGRPWVNLKMAASLDGRIALASGESQWITGEKARHDGQYWRARSCALITGIGTVLRDDPHLNVRHPPSLIDDLANSSTTTDTIAKGHYREPLKVVLDSLGAMPASAKILQGATVLSVGLEPNPGFTPTPEHAYWQAPELAGKINLWSVMEELAKRQCNEVMVEAGAILCGAFLESGLVDQLTLYLAPKFLGAKAMPLATFSSPTSLAQDWGFRLEESQVFGDDVRLIYVNKSAKLHSGIPIGNT